MSASVQLMMFTVNALLLIAHFEVFLSIGLNALVSILLATSTNIMTYILGKFDVQVMSTMLANDLRKVSIIKLGSRYLMQPLSFKVSRQVSIEVNLGGTLMPTAIAALISTYLMVNYGMHVFILLTLIVTASILIVNKLSVSIKGLGLAVPIFITSLIIASISILPALIMSMDVNLAVLCSYIVAYISILVGVDLMNMRRAILYDVKRIVIGGLKLYDALVLIPATSTILTYVITSLYSIYSPIFNAFSYLSSALQLPLLVLL